MTWRRVLTTRILRMTVKRRLPHRSDLGRGAFNRRAFGCSFGASILGQQPNVHLLLPRPFSPLKQLLTSY